MLLQKAIFCSITRLISHFCFKGLTVGEHFFGKYKAQRLIASGSKTHCMLINAQGARQPLLAAQVQEEHGAATGQGDRRHAYYTKTVFLETGH